MTPRGLLAAQVRWLRQVGPVPPWTPRVTAPTRRIAVLIRIRGDLGAHRDVGTVSLGLSSSRHQAAVRRLRAGDHEGGLPERPA